MFKKTIVFVDFNGKAQEKDFYFHLSNTELAMLSAGADDMKARIERIMKANDNLAILHELRELVKLACGIRSEDGERFIKTPEAQSQLLDSPAFDALLFELFVGKNAAEFFSKLVPETQQNQIKELIEQQAADPFKESTETDPRPAYQKENREPTPNELQKMNTTELQEAFRWREQNSK